MKTLKKIGIGLLILVLLLLILAFFLPKDLHVQKSKVIDAPISMLYSTVTDMSQQETWNSWATMDTTMDITVSSPSTGEGASYSWTSENSGEGKYTQHDLVYNESVRMDLDFAGQSAGGDWRFEEVDGGTEVTWSFDGTSPWPRNLTNFIGKMVLGKSFSKGLDMLDAHAKKTMEDALTKYDVKEVDFPYTTFLGKRDRVKMENVQTFYQDNLRPLYGYLLQNKIKPIGQPCGIFYDWNPEDGTADMASAIPIYEKFESADFENLIIPETRAWLIDYYGDYDGSMAAHNAMEYYFYKNGLSSDKPVIEEYVTDPTEQPERPDTWLTRVYYIK